MRESYCRGRTRANNITGVTCSVTTRDYARVASRKERKYLMAHEIPAGQSMLLIKRDAYERAGITRAAIDERLNLTADEFTVDGATRS